MPELNVWLNKITNTGPQDAEKLQQRAVEVLKEIYDPELPVNIYDLGLIYEVTANTDGMVDVHMTLTTPACPVAQTFPGTVETRLMQEVEGITSAHVELVWDPPWTPERLTDEVKLELGLL
jgi:FeS assembly SUF system protein